MNSYKQVFKLTNERGTFEAPKKLEEPGYGFSGDWQFVSMTAHPEQGAMVLWSAVVSPETVVK